MKVAAPVVAAAAMLCAAGCGDHQAARPDGVLVGRLVTQNAVVRVDLERDTSRVVPLHGLFPGDPPYDVAASGRRLVYYGRTRTYAIGASLRGRPRDLGESWYFVPGAERGRVWLAELDPHSPATVRALRAVREVTVGGRVVARSRGPLPSSTLVAATKSGPVFQLRRRGLVVWDPRSGRTLARLAGDFPVAVHGDRIAWCTARCPVLHVTGIAAHSDRTIRPLQGHPFIATYDGAFARDGRLLAVPVGRFDRPQVAVVDVRRGSVHVIPRSVLPTYGWTAWSPSGRWLLFSAGRRHIGAYDTATGHVERLPLRLPGAVVDMAALS